MWGAVRIDTGYLGVFTMGAGRFVVPATKILIRALFEGVRMFNNVSAIVGERSLGKSASPVPQGRNDRPLFTGIRSIGHQNPI